MIYFVPTPIGNLKDMTVRGVDVLNNVDKIFCEDTRKSNILMKEYKITTKLDSFHSKSSGSKLDKIFTLLDVKNSNYAFITDAGTPGISDPAYRIIKYCIENNIKYTVLPGASALTTAAILSGNIHKEFLYLGFIPNKKGRVKFMNIINQSNFPVVFYESVHRITKCIVQLNKILDNNKKITIVREISKMHEAVLHIDRLNISKIIEDNIWKGEFVIVVS